jgi:hypothetical protein
MSPKPARERLRVIKKNGTVMRLLQNFSFGTATIKLAVLQG